MKASKFLLVVFLCLSSQKEVVLSKVITKNPPLDKVSLKDVMDILVAMMDMLQQGPEVLEKVSDVKINVLQMTEDIASFVSGTGTTTNLLQDIKKSQNQFGGMLNSVFNTFLTFNSLLEDMQETNNKSLQTIIEALTKQKESESSCGSGEICHILDIILQTVNNTSTCQSQPLSSMALEDSSHSEVLDKIFSMQQESNDIIKQFTDSISKSNLLNDELQQVIKENQELRDKLRQHSPPIRASDCNDLRIAGVKQSGVYKIYPDSCSCSEGIRVWCDMETEGGGWTIVIARRHQNNQENFTRSWIEYETGFGHPEGEYWIGTSHLYTMTSSRRYSLRVDVTNQWGRSKWGQWGRFQVGSPNEGYKLRVRDFSLASSLGNVFLSHNDQRFSTYDVDNDSSFENNCAERLKGGWWYGRCYDIHPTGILNATDVNQGLSTSYFGYKKSEIAPLRSLTMKIRPEICTYRTTVAPSVTLSCDSDMGD